MKSWRLIIEGKNSASYNMAADDYLLELAEKGKTSPIIRIYSWDVPSITIGFHQKFELAVDIFKLDNTPVVRRITGGRALYHDDDELTYTVSGNFIAYPKLGQDLHQSYHLISKAIVLFYRNMLDWEADIARRDEPIGLGGKSERQKGCFSALSRHEIIVNGQKTAAGSQRRTKRALMQHGAIKLGQPAVHPAITEIPQTHKVKELGHADSDRDRLEKGLAEAFRETFEIDLIEGAFIAADKAAILSREDRFKNLNYI